MAPDRRLRGKTPDPARRHKSPDAKALRKAELKVKSKKPSGGSAEPKDPTRRSLTFDEKVKIHDIAAEHPAGDRRPAGNTTKPAPRKATKGDRMSSSEADKILAKFVQDQEPW